MAEPTTIRLTATAPLNGSGTIPLTRETLQTTTAGRLYSATIPSGSRLTSDIFGIFSSGAHTSITVTASTDNPRDVLRVYLGAAVRSEHRLAGPQTITLAPGEELAFITEAPTVLLLVVNELAEADQTDPPRSAPPPAVIRARLTRNAGFTATGVMNINLHWSTSLTCPRGHIQRPRRRPPARSPRPPPIPLRRLLLARPRLRLRRPYFSSAPPTASPATPPSNSSSPASGPPRAASATTICSPS
jgi:hypothetical protein